jgi:hypothetical protein
MEEEGTARVGGRLPSSRDCETSSSSEGGEEEEGEARMR